MYLMALSNFDYVLVTLLFAAVFIIAYLFRHQNESASEFLSTNNTCLDNIISYIGDFGIIEIVLAGFAASYWGLNAIYYIIFAMIIELSCQNILAKRYVTLGVNNCYDYVGIRCSNKARVLLASFNLLLLILLSSLAIAITFKVLQALMGWNFVNSVFGLLGITLIYIITGGYKGISYNKLLNYALVLLVIITATIVGVINLHSLPGIMHNLSTLAQAEVKSSDYYLFPPITISTLTIITVLTFGMSGFNLLQFRQHLNLADKNTSSRFIVTLLVRIAIAVILLLPGILAIATPEPTHTVAGTTIVTIPAQLPDGQTGYIIKTVDSNIKPTASPGIIPPVLNTKTNLLEKDNYNYLLASIVTIRHYLPNSVGVILLLTILSGFMLSIADYLFKLSLVTLQHIVIPTKMFDSYGDAGRLWTIRISILIFAILSLTMGYYVTFHADLLHYMAILVMLVISPLAAVLLLIGFGTVGKHSIISSLIIGKAVAAILIIAFFVFSELLALPTKCAIISGSSFIATSITGLYLWWKYEH